MEITNKQIVAFAHLGNEKIIETKDFVSGADYAIKFISTSYDSLIEDNRRLKEALQELYDFTISKKGSLDNILNNVEAALKQ